MEDEYVYVIISTGGFIRMHAFRLQFKYPKVYPRKFPNILLA